MTLTELRGRRAYSGHAVPKCLDGVCWIGHTPHSHTPEAPRWRVVMPPATPVSAKRWAEV
jgi:hypothetical protein